MNRPNDRLTISRESMENYHLLIAACEDLVHNAGRQIAGNPMPRRLVEEDDFQRICSLIGSAVPR